MLDVGGRIAFVSVIEKNKPAMRDLSIDTWLYHGDRRRTHWFWDGHTYGSLGGDQEIPAPRRFPHPERRGVKPVGARARSARYRRFALDYET